jgi:hypothetical protein
MAAGAGGEAETEKIETGDKEKRRWGLVFASVHEEINYGSFGGEEGSYIWSGQ